MDANHRDAGLVRAVGTWSLAAAAVSMVVGAGIFALPGILAACVGAYAPLVILVCALAVGAVAICFAEGGSRVPSSGGAYACIDAAFGPLVASVAGTCLWFGNVLACGAVAAALADVAASILPPAFRASAHVLVIVGVIGSIAILNAGGVKRGARWVTVVTLVKLIPLGIFVVVGVAAVHADAFTEAVKPESSGVGRAALLTIFALMGMETALCASGEVVQPFRTIPRALALTMVFVALLYMSIQLVAQGILGGALAQSSVPLADAMAKLNPSLRVLMLVGSGISMLGWISSDILGSPRILFAFARDGLLPRALGRVHPRSHAPHVAIYCYAIVAIGLALSGTFAELAVLSTLACAVLYIAGCAAAWQLTHDGMVGAGAPLNFRWLPVAVSIGIVSMLILVALASRAEMIGLAALLCISIAVSWLQSRRVALSRP